MQVWCLPILGCRRDAREVIIRERFFLGGASSLRGFAFKGVGPRAPRRADARKRARALPLPQRAPTLWAAIYMRRCARRCAVVARFAVLASTSVELR